jgi:hypothetical protein
VKKDTVKLDESERYGKPLKKGGQVFSNKCRAGSHTCGNLL